MPSRWELRALRDRALEQADATSIACIDATLGMLDLPPEEWELYRPVRRDGRLDFRNMPTLESMGWSRPSIRRDDRLAEFVYTTEGRDLDGKRVTCGSRVTFQAVAAGGDRAHQQALASLNFEVYRWWSLATEGRQ